MKEGEALKGVICLTASACNPSGPGALERGLGFFFPAIGASCRDEHSLEQEQTLVGGAEGKESASVEKFVTKIQINRRFGRLLKAVSNQTKPLFRS